MILRNNFKKVSQKNIFNKEEAKIIQTNNWIKNEKRIYFKNLEKLSAIHDLKK